MTYPNKTAETITGVMSNYGFNTTVYDDADRLTTWNRTDGNQNQSWNLTPVGDWNSFTENSVTQNRTHGNAHEILTMAASSLSHDANGNITTNSLGHSYQWDTDNHMSSANIPTGSSTDSYTYDAFGRRVSKTIASTTTVYVCSTNPIPFSQDAGQVIAEYGSGP